MEKNGWWNDQLETEWKDETKRNVMKAFVSAEQKVKPNLKEMFNDVYDQWPNHLKEQYNELQEHLKVYGEHYPLKNYQN